MTVTHHHAEEAESRLSAMLRTAFGPTVARFMQDRSVIEVMLNPDGRLWIERLGEGRIDTGYMLSPDDAERVIFLVASSIGSECSSTHPLVSAELPGCGSRFQGVLPPLVKSPTFTIRKKAVMVFTLDEYAKEGIMSAHERDCIVKAVKERKNILIAGGTGSGKTTLANAVLAEIGRQGDRLVIIEDTGELQCEAEDLIFLRTRDNLADMRELVKATMRLRPDRIIIGEVRGGEALELLKSWNTGHPGGLSTIHASGARQALSRLEQLIQEVVVQVPRSLIAEAVDLIIYIEKYGRSRRIKTIAQVTGMKDDEYCLELLP